MTSRADSSKPQTITHRYSLSATTPKVLSCIDAAKIKNSVAGVGDWLDSASAATGFAGGCYRTSLHHQNGQITWMYPYSNTTEIISAWLDIAEVLEEPRHIGKAEAYGARILEDPVKGLYGGEQESGRGMMYYWRNDGTYTGGYSMRAPEAFRRLHAATGDQRFLDASDVIGRAFLKRILPSGIVNMVGWCPKQGSILVDVVGSRYAYTVSTFALLFEMTSDPVYREAYEQVVEALLKMQQPDGSFFQHYRSETLEVPDPSIKIHFFSYIFNALAEAYSVFKDDRLVQCGRRMADFLAGHFYYLQQLPYAIQSDFATDRTEAASAVQDNANGLLWLYEVTGESVYLDMGAKLWLQAWLGQVDNPSLPGWHGALLRGMNPDLTPEMTKGFEGTHLEYVPSRTARCEVWFATNHVFASKRLVRLLGEAP